MPRVNLVPPEERQRAYRRQFYIIPVAGAIVLVGALAGSYYYFNNNLASVQTDLDSYKQNNASMQKQVAELQKYEELKNQKQARLSAVTSAYQGRFRWSRTLDDMSFVVPDTVSLIQITGQVPGAQTGTTAKTSATKMSDLEFEGYTSTMPDVAIFMVRLALIPSLSDVTLKIAEREVMGDLKPIHFIINANIKQPGETQRPAVAPTTGDAGPSPVTPTGTSTTPATSTGTSTSGPPPGRTISTGTTP